MISDRIDQSRKAKQRAVIFLATFGVSLLFPILGSVLNRQGEVLPVAGSLDVLVAFAAFAAFVFLSAAGKHQGREGLGEPLLRLLPYISSVPLLLIGLYFLGVRLNWEILLIGLGWRYWLLLSALPYLLAAFRKETATREP